jgi:serine/threonine protein kinase
MATLHLGRRMGEAGFARTVAIKRLRHELVNDPKFVAMFIDEARIAARIRHPNVTATVDVFRHEGELCLVLEYVHGESLRALLRAQVQRGCVDPRIAVSVMCGALHGLHAAHEAKSEQGEPLGIVHRDISPQNILVGADGITRVVDFGIAKAAGRIETTEMGQIKGKFAYMSPEQLTPGQALDRRTDVFCAGIVLWEALAGKRLFAGEDEIATVANVSSKEVPALRDISPAVSPELEQAVLRALEREPGKRFQSAREFARAIEKSVEGGPATSPLVGEWVEELAQKRLDLLDSYLHAIEVTLPSDDDDARASVRRMVDEESDRALLDVPPVSPARPPRASTPPDVSGHPTMPEGQARSGAEEDTVMPFFQEQDTTVDPMTVKLRPFKQAGEKEHSVSSLSLNKLVNPEAAQTAEQVLASVLATPLVETEAEGSSAAPASSKVPWIGALFGGESSDGVETTRHRGGPRFPFQPLALLRSGLARLRQDRLPVVIGAVALLVVLFFLVVHFSAQPEPTDGATPTPGTASSLATGTLGEPSWKGPPQDVSALPSASAEAPTPSASAPAVVPFKPRGNLRFPRNQPLK